MNKHQEARYIIEYENANQGVFTEKQMSELRIYITQSEATEKELEGLKEAIKVVNKHGSIKFSNGNFDKDLPIFETAKQTLKKVGDEK